MCKLVSCRIHSLNVSVFKYKSMHFMTRNMSTIEMKGITRWKLPIISESATCKKFLGQIWSYTASLQISNSHSLECRVVIFCLYHRVERKIIPFISMVILMNAQMSTQLKKNSLKSISCSRRIQQFPRNFQPWQAHGCIQVYSFKSMVSTIS